VQNSDCPYRGTPNLVIRSIAVFCALVIAAGAAVGQDADELRIVIPQLHGEPAMVRNVAGQWEAAAIVYQDASLELSVPIYLLDGEQAVDAISNAPLPLPWDGSGSYLVALYSFYKNSHGCVVDLLAAKQDSPENRAKCIGVRYQQRFLTIDPHNRTVTEVSYVLVGANGLALLPPEWPRTSYPLDGPLINAHVAMLRKAIAHLQPLADRNAAANVTVQSDYHKMFEQSRQIARESVTTSGQGGSIVQETPEMRTRMKQLEPQLQEQAVRNQVDGQRWTCGASGYTKQECETRFPYSSTPATAKPLDHNDKPIGDLAQAASSQETGVIEQKALALYNQKHYSDAGPLFEQACAGGGFEGCGFLGYMYQNQLGVARDYARAATAYKKACEGKNAFACSQLGYMYQYRLGVEQDYPLAATLFLKACDGGSANGCVNLGYLYQHSLGVAQDYPRAVSLFSQGCNAGTAVGCNNLGIMFATGSGVEKDLAHAAALFSNACDAHDPVGCSDLGSSYLTGNGVEKDLGKAKLFFRKGCSLGDKSGCEQAEQLP
jgi:TPR repeat protein